MEKNIWQKNRVELFRDLDCGEGGLTSAQAAERQAKYGPNELREGGRKSTLRIFLEQFADFIVIILILAAIVSAFTGEVESTIVILAVITMNAILGTVQTVKAAASLESLKQMSAPTAKVLRDGQILQIPGREVVPGDVATWWCWRPATPSAPTAACWSAPASSAPRPPSPARACRWRRSWGRSPAMCPWVTGRTWSSPGASSPTAGAASW